MLFEVCIDSISTIDASLLVVLPEQVETFLLGFECFAWLKDTRGLAAVAECSWFSGTLTRFLPFSKVSEVLSQEPCAVH